MSCTIEIMVTTHGDCAMFMPYDRSVIFLLPIDDILAFTQLPSTLWMVSEEAGKAIRNRAS